MRFAIKDPRTEPSTIEDNKEMPADVGDFDLADHRQQATQWCNRSKVVLDSCSWGSMQSYDLWEEVCIRIYVQPIADRVAQNLEIISKNFRFSTRRTRIFWDLSFITWY